MACRNLETSKAVCKEIIDKTNNDNVEVIPLDILINKAGHFKHGESGFQESLDGM